MTNFGLFQTESLQTTILNLMKVAESLPKGLKMLLEKEKFSFSLGVFKRLVLQTSKNKGLFGKKLSLYHTVQTFNDQKSSL